MVVQSAVRYPECPDASDIRPLSFDRVFENYAFSSSFPLFQLPVELFPQVILHLSWKDLKSLSLVDRDCRNLAALSLFKNLEMNFTAKTSSSIAAYRPEEGRRADHVIASCIRRLRLVAGSEWNRPSSIVSTPGSDVQEHPVKFGLPCLMSYMRILPNLHIFDCDIPSPVPTPLLQSIYSLQVKHLRVNGMMLVEDLETPLIPGCLPLETLSLNITVPGMKDRSRIPPFYDNLLRHTAPTLRRLELTGHPFEEHIHAFDPPVFPQLRSLMLDGGVAHNSRLLEILLGATTRIHTLALDSSTSSIRDFYQSRGYIPSLEHFCWINKLDAYSISQDDVMAFLLNNSHLQSVHVSDRLPPSFIDTTLLPTLSTEFTSLTSLKLVWDAEVISQTSLRLVSTIQTLRHLWLSAGSQDALRNTWEIDTGSMVENLRPLCHLETLAFSKDTYPINTHPLAPIFCDYYATKALPADVPICMYLTDVEFAGYRDTKGGFDHALSQQIRIRRIAWERWHAERMLRLAEDFANAFTALAWCYLGQLPFIIDYETGKRAIILASSTRSPCLSPLHNKMSFNTWRPA